MKFLALFLIFIIAPIIAGVYGILHDQITYSISHEYYTKFKFEQFGLIETGYRGNIEDPRILVCVVGFAATWWMGIPIGIILGLVCLIHTTASNMLKAALRSFLVTILVAFSTGIIGLLYGNIYLANTGVDWWLPDDLINKANFISVGSMHNFSYLGGIIGIFAGIMSSINYKRKLTLSPDQE